MCEVVRLPEHRSVKRKGLIRGRELIGKVIGGVRMKAQHVANN